MSIHNQSNEHGTPWVSAVVLMRTNCECLTRPDQILFLKNHQHEKMFDR